MSEVPQRVTKITIYVTVPEGQEHLITDAGKENIRSLMFGFVYDAEGVTVEVVDGPIPVEALRPLGKMDEFDETGKRIN